MNKELIWLENKLESLRSFNGSLLGYVGSSPNVMELASKLGVSPSEVLKLDSNENFFVQSEFLNNTFQETLKEVDLRFYDPKALSDLAKSLGKYLNVPPECIVVGSGSEQLIDFIAQFFLEKGDEAISIVPSFFMYGKRVSLSGATLRASTLKSDLSIDVDDILRKVTPKTKLIFGSVPV
jgi:histidinol-phosphate aminotransferase